MIFLKLSSCVSLGFERTHKHALRHTNREMRVTTGRRQSVPDKTKNYRPDIARTGAKNARHQRPPSNFFSQCAQDPFVHTARSTRDQETKFVLSRRVLITRRVIAAAVVRQRYRRLIIDGHRRVSKQTPNTYDTRRILPYCPAKRCKNDVDIAIE